MMQPGRAAGHDKHCHCHQQLWRAEDSHYFGLPQSATYKTSTWCSMLFLSIASWQTYA